MNDTPLPSGFARYPTAAERKASRRKVVKTTALVQTYRIFATLACGHKTSWTVTALRYAAGDRGPSNPQCWECAQQMCDKRIDGAK